MAVIILITIVIVLLMERRKSKEVPEHPLFAVSTGLSAGFTTMLGNLAGAFANLYFLAMRMPKNNFIGTAAWLLLMYESFQITVPGILLEEYYYTKFANRSVLFQHSLWVFGQG
jgi:hypothetical protein